MLLWIDGFDNYGTTIGAVPSPSGVVARNYGVAPSNTHMQIQTARLSGYSLRFYNGEYATAHLCPVTLTTNATMIVGVAVKFGSIIDQSRFIRFVDGANIGISLNLRVGGELSVHNTRLSTQLGITTGLRLLAETWYYVEIKVVAGSSGSCEVKVGGVSVLNVSGDTRATVGHDYSSTFALTNPNYSALVTYFDDLYCLDGSGSVNNDFLGNVRVVTIRPDAAGDSAQFTSDSGSNYARVNEAICGDDSNYVEDAVADEKDLYNYGALGGVLTSIAGIVVSTMCRETDATNFNLKTVCKSGVTESDDAGQAIGSTSYVTRRRLMETDPNTGVAWTPTTLEAAQFGVKVA